MPKSRPPYPPTFRRQMVELVRTGRTPEELAREFEPTAQAIRNWVAQAARDDGRRGDGLSSAEREETRRLREERATLAKFILGCIRFSLAKTHSSHLLSVMDNR